MTSKETAPLSASGYKTVVPGVLILAMNALIDSRMVNGCATIDIVETADAFHEAGYNMGTVIQLGWMEQIKEMYEKEDWDVEFHVLTGQSFPSEMSFSVG